MLEQERHEVIWLVSMVVDEKKTQNGSRASPGHRTRGDLNSFEFQSCVLRMAHCCLLIKPNAPISIVLFRSFSPQMNYNGYEDRDLSFTFL
jgi:hypothetical protein